MSHSRPLGVARIGLRLVQRDRVLPAGLHFARYGVRRREPVALGETVAAGAEEGTPGNL
jgi:hypothetical protein